jgi:hypothetical protein
MLATQCIGYTIRFTRVVVDVQIVVLDQFKPPSLHQVQRRLCKDVLQTLVVSVNVKLVAHQVVPPYLQSVNDSF